MQKPPENRVKTAIPGVICKEGAARRRPGSHSSRPKRTSFAALEDSIADRAANGKGVRRANEALERANFARKNRDFGADRRGRGRAWPVRGVRGICWQPSKIWEAQRDKSVKTMGRRPFARFSRGFGRLSLKHGPNNKGTEKRFITKSK